MQTTVMESFFLWNGSNIPFLWMAGSAIGNGFRYIPYRTVLRLEFWRLSEPHDSPALDRRAIFPDLLHLSEGAPCSHPYRCNASHPASVQGGQMRRRPDRNLPADIRHIGGSCPILWPVLQMVCLGDAGSPCADHACSFNAVRFGERLVPGTVQALAGLLLDAVSVSLQVPSPSGRPGDLERKLLLRISSVPWRSGSGLPSAFFRPLASMLSADIRRSLAIFSRRRKDHGDRGMNWAPADWCQPIGGACHSPLFLSL